MQLSHVLSEEIFSIVPQKHCFATAIATAEQKRNICNGQALFRGMKIEGFVANFPWIALHLVQTLSGGALSLVDATTFR